MNVINNVQFEIMQLIQNYETCYLVKKVYDIDGM